MLQLTVLIEVTESSRLSNIRWLLEVQTSKINVTHLQNIWLLSWGIVKNVSTRFIQDKAGSEFWTILKPWEIHQISERTNESIHGMDGWMDELEQMSL